MLLKCVQNQSVSDFEWLLLDDSPAPSQFMQDVSDPRIVYEYSQARKTVGAKRNHLIQKSRGGIIAQFDDDDFYGQDYLSRMIGVMNENNADIVKLFGFFLYDMQYRIFGYWDLMTKDGPHWSLSGPAPTLVELDKEVFKDNHLGFGFSYVYKKIVWEFSKFPERNFDEEGPFLEKALQRFKLIGVQDAHCTCIHVTHGGNLSACFPQYKIPNFLIQKLFPGVTQYLAP